MIKARDLLIPLCAGILAVQPASAQADPGTLYESRFVEAAGIRLQYHDFGGSGLPVIFVQDFHDYFGAALDPEWPPFPARFADRYRVLAPVRRGWGESEDTGYGYDVATQAEDLLAFMDALGIERAVLVGRTPADQDMTWIAEHHPERLAGLVYLHGLHVVGDFGDPLIRAFTEAYSAGSCDMPDPIPQVGARSSWRPHFLDDEAARIDVPALRFFWPFDEVSMNLRRLDRVAEIADSEVGCPGAEESREYFAALAADEERQAELRRALLDTDLQEALDQGMQRAFGDDLRTIRQSAGFGDWPAIQEFQAGHMRSFLEEVERAPVGAEAPVVGNDTVRVAQPTGEREADRASILAALERARPGDVVQFGPGTYLVGELIPIETPQLTMLGHANGTTLRGCEPDAYKQLERDRQAVWDDLQARIRVMGRCGVFEMTGGHGTVRGLTFEHTWMGLALGAASSIENRTTEGGYLVENNVFRNSGNGVRPGFLSSAPTVIRGNRFMNVFHAVSGAGAGIHVVDNDISVPEPDTIALPEGPGFAIGIGPAEECVIEGNRIEGHRDGIVLFGFAGQTTRRNVIRDNTIIGTVFPLGLWADQEDVEAIQIEDNLIEGNRVMGGAGVGIALNGASGNRILDNVISGIALRDPSLGEANGSGIWLSPGSDENMIAGNTFEDIATYPIVLEGDSNRVELRSASDEVRDLGQGNRVDAHGIGAVQPGDSGAAGLQDATPAVRVAPPTGQRDTDRESILAALEQVEPGGTVLFAPGTYLIGEIVHVPVPGITVVGHPEGTILRGCDPDDGTLDRMLEAVVQCNGLDMAGGHQTVRNVTFEHAWHALTLGGLECRIPGGCRPHGEPVESREGGYRVEGNTFRAVGNGVRALGEWDDPAVIRDNEFIDTFHAVVVHGSTVHVLGNDIRSPSPERVPNTGYPGGALFLSATDLNLEFSLRCAGNVIEGNRVEGHPDGIGISLYRPGTSCRDNVIRGNTIRTARVPVSTEESGDPSAAVADGSAVGMPIFLIGSPEVFGLPRDSAAATDPDGVLEDNLIEGNRILGAEGLGIELFRASRNRIVDNTIVGVRLRDPFPGRTVNSADPEKSGWRDANGSAIWLSPGSDENQIVGNTFEDLSSHAIVLEGDGNGVELRSTSDSVRDLGAGNRVTQPRTGAEATNQNRRTGAPSWTDPSPHEVRFVSVAPDVSLEVLDWGGTGEPLVLLAGMQATGHTFDDFAPELTDEFRVLAVTRRGFGASSQPDAGYDLDTLVNDVRVVLDSLGIGRAALVGHSLGATEAARFASLWPGRVSAVVNIDGLMIVDGEAFMQAMATTPAPPAVGDADRTSVAAFGNYIARIYGVPLPEAEIRARWSILPDGTVGDPVTPDRIMAAISQHDSSTPLDDVRVPLLALRAVSSSPATLIPYYDDLGPDGREQAGRAFPALRRIFEEGWAPYARMPTATIVDFPDANHHLYISRRDEIVERVRGFLRGLSERREDTFADTIQVPPPAGDESDRSIISAALERAGPGETASARCEVTP